MSEEQLAIARSSSDSPINLPESDPFAGAHAQFVQQIWGMPTDATLLKTTGQTEQGSGFVDFTSGNFVRAALTAGQAQAGGGGGDAGPGADPDSGKTGLDTEVALKLDPKWADLLGDPQKGTAPKLNIDRSQTDGTDGQGHQLADRTTDQVHNIIVRQGHKDGDQPANYRVGKDGKIQELIPPDKSAMGSGDDSVVIEMDTSAANAAEQANAQQIASAQGLIAQIQADCAQAGVAPNIPSNILSMLQPKAVPQAHSVVRGHGGNGGMTGAYQPHAEGGAAPAAPARQFVGGNNKEIPGAVQAKHVDMTHFNVDHLTIPEKLKPVVSQIISMISHNEGSPTSINWNDNGHGLSIGMFQANLKVGEGPALLKRMHKDNPQLFDKIFGPYAQKMLDENFVRSAYITKGSDLGNRIQQALNQHIFQETQLVMLGDKVMHAAETLQRRTGVVPSEKMVALFTDATNQLGEGGAGQYLKRGMSDWHDLDRALRSGSHWRAERNPKVVAQMNAAQLSDRPGSFTA